MSNQVKRTTWSWLTDKHFNELEQFNDELRFDITKTNANSLYEVMIPVVLPLDEALTLAIHRDGRNRNVIAREISVHKVTLGNIINQKFKPKIGVLKKVLVYCAKFNCKILLMKS